MDDKEKKGEQVPDEIQRIRMTLRSKEVKPLEAACAEIVSRAKNQDYETKGPVRIPTKILRITTRKTPCGEGSKTWDRYEMRIHKRVIDIHCPSSVVKEITNFRIDPGVDVNLIMKNINFPITNPANKQRLQSQNELLRLLPQISDQERQQVREQIFDTLSKQMSPSQVKLLMDQNNMGDGGSTGDRGEYSEMTALEVSIQLETLIFAKYSDTSSPNYKALSKKVVMSIKSRGDQRIQLLEIKDHSEVEDFLQNFMSSRGRGLAAQQQESSGSQATTNGPPQSQNNPFAFPQSRQGPSGMPPNQSKKSAQSKFPQNRFMAPTIFSQPQPQQEQESSKRNEQDNDQASSWPQEDSKDLDRPSLNQNEDSNKNFEDSKNQSKSNLQYSDFPESGAADQSHSYNQQREEKKAQENNMSPKTQVQEKKSGYNQDDFDFFNKLAENAVKQDTNSPSIDQQFKSETFQPPIKQNESFRGGEEPQINQQQIIQQQHSIQEEQSRGYPSTQDIQEQPDYQNQEQMIQNESSNQSTQEGPQNLRILYPINPRQLQEGKIFGSKDNLEQEEGLQTQFSVNDLPSSSIPEEHTSDQHYNDYLQQQTIEQEEQRPSQVVEEVKNEYYQQVEQAQADSYDFQNKNLIKDSMQQEFEMPNQLPPKSRNNTHYEKQKTSPPPKELGMIHTQSLQDLHDPKRLTPSVKGFFPISSSRPPQSVASVNITNLEDSEALIRAYRRKKLEVDDFKQKFYEIETEFFTLKEKSKHAEEENAQVKLQLAKTEKQLKDFLYKDSKNDRDVFQKQLQLKSSQLESYQKELQNQKQENQKLREKMKEMMNRNKSNTPSVSSTKVESQLQQVDQSEIIKERDHYMMLANQYKQDFDNLQNEYQDFRNLQHQNQRTSKEDANYQIEQLKKQISQQRMDSEQQLHLQIQRNQKLQQELQKMEQLKKNSPIIEQKSSSNGRKSEEESISFEKIQGSSPTGQEEAIEFAGYYERKMSSDESRGSAKKEEKAKTSNIQANYFKNDENEKQSSAPPSQPKQQPRVQPQAYQSQNKNQQQNIQEDSHEFFDKLSSQGSQSVQQKQVPKQQPINQQQAIPQNRPPPQQVNQNQRPPVRNQPPPQNAYGFDLDDISFEQPKQAPVQKNPQTQYRPSPPKQMQQQTRPQVPQNQYRPQVPQQKQQPQPQNFNQYGFQVEDSNSPVAKQPSGAPNIIPKSLFD